MAKTGFGCERKECCASSGILEEVTFGTGELSDYGYWEEPCKKCQDAWIRLYGSVHSIVHVAVQYNVTTA